MRLLASLVVLLSISAVDGSAADITAHLTELWGRKPSDREIADFLVSDAGYEWRRVNNLLPQRSDGLPTAPTNGANADARPPELPTEEPGGIQTTEEMIRSLGTPDARSLVPPAGAFVAQDGPGAPTPGPAAAATRPQPVRTGAPPRRPGETQAQYDERVRRAAPPSDATAARLTPDGQARAQQNAQGLVGLFQQLFRPLDPDAALGSASPGAAPGAASPGRVGGGKGSRAAASSGAMKPAQAGMGVGELQIAAAGGMGQPFRDMGLKVGPGPGGGASVLRADGKPASSAEVAELQRRLAREPLAQMQRPDFHQVIPRDKFAELRSHYATKPELRETTFKDVAATAEVRDFQWSRTCTRLDGNCNPNATQGSYAKGRFVSPEDLKNMSADAAARLKAEPAPPKAGAKEDAKSFWERLRKEDEQYRKQMASARGSEPAPRGGGLSGRLSALLSALSGALGGGSSGDADATAYDERLALDAEGRPLAESGEAVGAPTARRESDLAATRRMPAPAPPNAPGGGARRVALWGFMAALAALLAVYARRRVKETA
ncbi:MAG: hypothetical protein SF051_03400 [Elusimicrobiota bacterium]|nr:hypothetical protein [Elusimicrobiota bacterium]